MELGTQKRIQAEKLAHQIVLDCIEAPCIDTDTLVNQVIPRISSQHYEDIEIERSLSSLCGYPCCSRQLQPYNSTSLKYHIDCRSKKVFDITNRSKFCSDWCFAASKYILEQIPETPVWTRNEKQTKTISLYPKDRTGKPGEEVILNELAEELRQINLIDRRNDGELTDELEEPAEFSVDDSESKGYKCRKVKFLPEPVVVNVKDEDEYTTYSQNEPGDVKMYNLYCSLCNQLFAWRTHKTVQFLTDQSSPERLLDEEFCLRIAHFYSKNQSLDISGKKENENVENAVIVPNIDSKNQTRERREIVLRAVAKYFNNIASSDILLSSKEAWSRICTLVETFNLNAANVFVDPRTSELLLVLFLSILSNVDNSLIAEAEKFQELSINVYKRFGYCDLNELQNFIVHFWKF